MLVTSSSMKKKKDNFFFTFLLFIATQMQMRRQSSQDIDIYRNLAQSLTIILMKVVLPGLFQYVQLQRHEFMKQNQCLYIFSVLL